MDNTKRIYAVTNRLIIRQFALHDIQSFYEYRADPAVSRFQSWDKYTHEEAEAFVRAQMTNIPNQPGEWFQYAIALGDSNQLIGDCAIHTLGAESRIVEIGFTLAPEHQGKGYIHDALHALFDYIFNTLNKHKVIAFTDVRNEKSISVLERLGMRREGHLEKPQLGPNQRKEFAPVDFVSKAIVAICKEPANLGKAYHLVPPYEKSMDLVDFYSKCLSYDWNHLS